MNRDPLCDYQIHFAKRQPCPICELFAKARADERERIRRAVATTPGWTGNAGIYRRNVLSTICRECSGADTCGCHCHKNPHWGHGR